jgi:hypothetical protein
MVAGNDWSATPQAVSLVSFDTGVTSATAIATPISPGLSRTDLETERK